MSSKFQQWVKRHPWIKKKSTKIAMIVIASLLVVLLTAGCTVYFFLKAKIDNIPSESIDVSSLGVSDNLNLTGYRNIAILGLDTRGDNYDTGNRSDCIIIASINNDTSEVRLISVYRDTYLDINGILDKATHAYAYGGAQATLKMLNENLDLNITEFVAVNFESVVKAVDLLDGIPMKITSDEIPHLNGYIEELNYILKTNIKPITEAGDYILNGVQALAYSRIRYTAGGDYKRTERIRDVIKAMFEKIKTRSLSDINKLVDIMIPEILISDTLKKDLIPMIPTLLKFNISESLGWPYNVRGATIGGTWYGLPNTLESCVKQLHVEVFNDPDYVVPQKIKDISQRIQDKVAYTPVTSGGGSSSITGEPMPDETDPPIIDQSGASSETLPEDETSSAPLDESSSMPSEGESSSEPEEGTGENEETSSPSQESSDEAA